VERIEEEEVLKSLLQKPITVGFWVDCLVLSRFW